MSGTEETSTESDDSTKDETKDNETNDDKNDTQESKEDAGKKPKPETDESASEHKGDEDSETKDDKDSKDNDAEKDGVRPKSQKNRIRKVKVKRATTTTEVAAPAKVTKQKISKSQRLAPVVRGRQKTHVKVSSKELAEKAEPFGRRVLKRYKFF